MRLETFFEKFELFTDAPNAVAKMRELILEVAIQGLLVEQRPTDTPALDCLRKSSRAVRALSTNDVPVPTGWVSIPLGCVIASNTGGGTPSKQNASYWNGAIPWASVKDIQSEKYLTTTIDSITEEGLRNSSSNLIPANRLLVVTRMGLGKLAINKMPVAINQDLRAIEPNEALDLDFAYLLFKALKMVGKGVTVKGITIDVLHAMPVALPPLAEQKRIVAKVDELMALCDRLEAQQQERDTRHAALARASLARFAEAPTPANLNVLFCPSYPITPADLRKTILTLAVQGKLVPQEPNDELASNSLHVVGVDLRRWAVANDEQRFTTPASWVWMRFAGVGDQRLGKMLDAHKNRGEPKPYLRNTNVQWMRFELDDVKEMRVEKDEEEELRLQRGDLLICEGGEPGRCAIWDERVAEMYFQKALHRVRPCSAILSEYLALNLQTDCQNDVLASYFTGATIKHLTGRSLSQYPVPIPPLAEQRRIVAKVDQLMVLVDRLETRLSEAEAKSAALLDAVIHEVLNPTAEVVDLTRYRAAVGCYAISKMQGKRYFGRTAAMKVLYLAEAHVGLELGLKPMREAAGPFDTWLYRFEEQGEREACFKVVESTTAGGKKRIEYRPGRALAEQSALAERIFTPDQRKEFDRLLALFSDRTTEEAEIIATLFAAWNDFLIDGNAPGDDEIIREVRENWHEKKERFTSAQLRTWLGWLSQNDLVPRGRLPRTTHQTQLRLN